MADPTSDTFPGSVSSICLHLTTCGLNFEVGSVLQCPPLGVCVLLLSVERENHMTERQF